MNNQDPSMQKRMLLFTVIVFVLFIVYEFTVLKPQQEARQQIAQEEKLNANNATKAPSVSQVSQDAPSMATDTPNMNLSPVSTNEIITTVKMSQSILKIDKLGRISQVTLTESKYVDEDGKQLNLLMAGHLKPLELRFPDASTNSAAFETSYIASNMEVDATTSGRTLLLTQTLPTTTVTKKFTFFPKGNYKLTVKTTNNVKFFMTNGARPDISSGNVGEMVAKGSIIKLNDDTLVTIEDGDAEKDQNIKSAKFVSNFDKYYATLLYNISKPFTLTVMPDEEENPQAFIHGNSNISLGGYVGPKEHTVLNSIDPELVDAIEYGWFTFIAKPVFVFLQFIQSIVGNWGWSIVILTVLIKLVLFPLSYKGMVSMQKLKDLAPKMKEIQAKYKDDKQKQSTHMMELYKKHGANPMGGCLPLVLQIPVFFAIYRVLLNSIELKGAPWMLWIQDLALMDPYFVLPIIMGASMYLQQKITPNTMQDEMQKKIFQFLPVVFTFFFLWFPAGLTLYWVVNNVFTIGQQYYINRLFEKKRAEKK